MTRTYRVTHNTRYTYDDDVTDSYGLALSRPRELPFQTVRETEFWTEPATEDRRDHIDLEGNIGTYFHLTTPHRELVVSQVSTVVCRSSADVFAPEAAAMPWERALPSQRTDLPEAPLVAQYVSPSPLVDIDGDVFAYAAHSLTPGRPLLEAVTELVHRINTEFDYDPGSTDVSTRVPEVLGARAGVCQDFAHLLIACLRSHGLAARYVSGYLSTDPPPGRERMVGADATHAWVHCWFPRLRGIRAGALTPEASSADDWLSVDPTNDCITSDRHITVAWGRDYADVPPVKGVIFTEAKESLMVVSVDVAPID